MGAIAPHWAELRHRKETPTRGPQRCLMGVPGNTNAIQILVSQGVGLGVPRFDLDPFKLVWRLKGSVSRAPKKWSQGPLELLNFTVPAEISISQIQFADIPRSISGKLRPRGLHSRPLPP